MLKLIRLEYKKNNIKKYIRNMIIMVAALSVFFFAFVYLGIANEPDTGIPDAAMGANGVSSNVELITSIAFMIFAAVMHSSFIISRYKNKTMNLMFSYPIKRQMILASEMASVWIFCFISLVFTKILIYALVFIGSKFFHPSFIIDYNMLSLNFYIQILIKSVMTISISFIALFIGLLVKSSKAAIVSSFFLIILMQGNIGGVTFAANIVLPVLLTGISFIFAYLSVQNIENKDI